MNIFPEQVLSKTEEEHIATLMSNPVVVKYLQTLAYNIGRDLVISVIEVEEPEEHWLRKELFLKGQLRILDMLLSIKPAVETQPQS